MAESQLVTFGAHTMNHPILAALTDPSELRYEITACRSVLEQRLGRTISTLAYPVGKRQHISAQTIQMTREAGYRWAMTTQYGINTANSDPYLLKRMEVDVNQHWLVVAAEAAGLWGLIHFIRWLPFVHTYLKRFYAREETRI